MKTTTTGLFFFFFSFFFFVCCWLLLLLPPASGVPVHRPLQQSVEHVGDNVTLPCRLTASVDPPPVTASVDPPPVTASVDPPPVTASVDPPPVTAVEWFWLDDLTRSWVTVHVSRGGKELRKEKSSAYRRSTAVTKDGSLMLFSVQQRDSGTYRCVLVRGSEREEAQVTLLVVQLPKVNFSVSRTEANRLMVYCESRGWKQKPEVSVRDSDGNHAANKTEYPDQDDGLHAVRTLVREGSGTFICRVEIPGGNAMTENKISVSDQFIPGQGRTGLDSFPWITAIGVLEGVFLVASLAVYWRRKLIDFLLLKQWLTGDGVYTEFGDINQIQTSGASRKTVEGARLTSTGTDHSGTAASGELAKQDFNEMLKYRPNIMRVGRRLKVHPCLIAGIISRQSVAGTALIEDGESKGYGKQDQNCFGLMQINQKYHAVKGGPYSEEHLDHGVTILIQSIKTMTRENANWSKEDQLKGALACYIAGEPNVTGLAPKDVDTKTPNGDFANDVIARAQWFARNRFM